MRKFQIIDKYSLPERERSYHGLSDIEDYVADLKEDAVEKARKLINSDHSEYYVVEVHAKVMPEKREFKTTVEEITQETTNDSISE